MQDVLGDESGHVDGVFRRGEGRGVSLFGFAQILHSSFVPYDLCNHLNPLVNPLHADDLCSQNLPGFGMEQQFGVHHFGCRIVAGVGGRVGVGCDVWNALFCQLFFVQTDCCCVQVENFGDGCADAPPVLAVVAEGDVVGCDPRLLVCRSCQGQKHRMLQQHVRNLHRIADRIDVGVGGLHVAVYGNSTQGAEAQSGRFGQCGVWAHTHA